MLLPEATPISREDPVGRDDLPPVEPSWHSIGATSDLLHEFRGRLYSLQEIASVVNSDLDLSRILQTIVDAICQHTSWSLAGIMAIDEPSGYSVLMARHDPGREMSPVTPDRWPLSASPSPVVVREQRPIIILNAQERDDFPGYRDDARARGYHTVVVLPLSATDLEGRAMALSVESTEHVDVTDEEVSFLEAVAHHASIAVRNASLLQAERDQAAKLQRSLGTHAELMRHALNEASLGTLIRVVEGVLGKPLTVIDATSNIIAAGRSPDAALLSDAEWSEFVSRRAGRRLLELIPAGGEAALAERVVDFRPLGLEFTSSAVAEPIVVDERRLGGMIVFEGSSGFDDLDLLLIGEARFALSIQMMRGYIGFQVESQFQADLLRRLFSGDWRDPEELLLRAGYLGINLSQPACLLIIASAGDPPLLDNHLPDVDQLYLHRRLARLAEQSSPGAKVVIDGSDLVAFVPVGEGAMTVDGLSQRLQTETKQATGIELVVAVSSECHDLRDYQQARRECSQLVAIGRQLGRRGTIRRSDVGPYGLLFSAASGESVRDFVNHTIGALEAYDAQHHAHLTETLEAFVRNSGRFQAAADELRIHVSTLRYRLDRVAAVAGIDLENPDSRFTAELALRLRKLLH
jgi:DNA-binding PucR family transcriptional regulator